MGRAHEVRAAAMAKTAAAKSKLYARFGKEIYIAAKNGVPDPAMNLTLAKKIKEAKSNQVTADVIKRAIDRAKGGDSVSYDECRYEGFGPGNTTFIVDCLTDNTNRTYTAVKSAFNHTKGAKLVGSGAVSFNYQRLGIFSFASSLTEDEIMTLLMENDVDIISLDVEDGYIDMTVAATDYGKVTDLLEQKLGEINYDRCEIGMVPNETVQLSSADDIEYYNKLMGLLTECEDVNKVYTNAVIAE